MIHIAARSSADLKAAIELLYSKKVLTDLSPQRQQNDLYIVVIRSKISKSEVQKIISKRFGQLVKVIS